jgi:hypothetical protein
MKNTFEKNGKKYMRIGDKAIPFDDYDKEGRPIIKPKVETKEYPDGRKDATVKIPALTIKGKSEK